MINTRQEGETRETREKMKMRRRKPLTNTFRRKFLNNPPFSPLSIHFYHEFEPRTKRFQLLFTLTISLRNKISSFPYLFIYITLSLSYSFFLKERKKRIHLEPFDLRYEILNFPQRAQWDENGERWRKEGGAAPWKIAVTIIQKIYTVPREHTRWEEVACAPGSWR